MLRPRRWRCGFTVGVVAVVLVCALGAGSAQANWEGIITVNDMNGNELPGPALRMSDEGGGLFLGEPILQGFNGSRTWFYPGGGLAEFFTDNDRRCNPEHAHAYPFTMDTEEEGVPTELCWIMGEAPRLIFDGDQLRFTAEPSWTDESTGTKWLFDHWVINNVKAGCAQGTSSNECTITLQGEAPWNVHAFYRQQPPPPTCTTVAGRAVYHTGGQAGLLTNRLNTGLAVPQRLRLSTGVRLRRLQEATCTGAVGSRVFEGKGTAAKGTANGYTLTFAIKEEAGGMSFQYKLDKGAEEIEESNGPLEPHRPVAGSFEKIS